MVTDENGYLLVQDGEEHFPQLKGFEMRCCDCGLKHSMDFKVYEKLGDGTMVEISIEDVLISITARRLP